MSDVTDQLTFWDLGRPKRHRTPFKSLSPAVPTAVYDTYWRFAAERQAIFFRRFRGEQPPWTDDPILQTYKFTNAYRASDRVSQYLIRRVISQADCSAYNTFFRIILFKLFNKISTWELLCTEVGEPTYDDYSFTSYDRILTQAMERGHSIYSAAYIMPSGSRAAGSTKKHRSHLRLLEQMMADGVPDQISQHSSMRQSFELLLSYPMIGEFLAYQYVTDLNYSDLCNFSEMEFVVPGPGAIDGISKCFSSLGGLSESEIIRLVAQRQELEFERLGLSFESLWGRKLQLIDCQNLFCEISKYARVRHPEVIGVAKRTRIKQKYKATEGPLQYWYPVKWGINSRIAAMQGQIQEEG